MRVKLKIRANESKVKSPTLAKNRTARMGHPKAFFGIKARPPALAKNRTTRMSHPKAFFGIEARPPAFVLTKDWARVMAERRYYGLLAPRYPNSAFKLNFFCERSGDPLPLVMGV
jgi:hypothetical protein